MLVTSRIHHCFNHHSMNLTSCNPLFIRNASCSFLIWQAMVTDTHWSPKVSVIVCNWMPQLYLVFRSSQQDNSTRPSNLQFQALMPGPLLDLIRQILYSRLVSRSQSRCSCLAPRFQLFRVGDDGKSWGRSVIWPGYCPHDPHAYRPWYRLWDAEFSKGWEAIECVGGAAPEVLRETHFDS